MPQSSRSTVSIRKLMYTLTFKVKYRGYPIHCQINMVICINNDYVNRYYSQEKGVGKATSPINNYRTSKISATV